jgi:hypothetical protein
MKIYVIYADYGYDGCDTPEFAFTTIEKAEAKRVTLVKPSDYQITEIELEEEPK